jgi:MFS transporter
LKHQRSFLLTYLGLAVAGSAAYAMSTLFSALKPVLLTRYIEQVSFSPALSGLIVAMPFVGIACASLFMRGWLLRLPYWAVVNLFGVGLIVIELLSAVLFAAAGFILPAQWLGGVCVGVLMGTTSRYIATTHTPDKLFGFVDMTAVFLMSFMVYGVGRTVESAGLQGGYLFAAIVVFIFAGAMLFFRGSSADRQGTKAAPPPLKLSVRPVAVVILGMLFVTSSGLGFAFMFTMAKELGMSYDRAGTDIGILLFLSAFACQLGGWASARFGHARPLAGAFITCAVGWYIAIHAQSGGVFLAALVPAVFSLQFNFPILLALAGSLDRHGQWAAIASPLLTSGFAWAAISAGIIVRTWDIEALASATAIGMLLCLGLLQLTLERSPLPVQSEP